MEPTTITDHVIPHRGDMAVFWDSSKWQPACDWHHNEIKQKLEMLFDQGKAKVEDLWLNSEKAKALSLEFRAGGEVKSL